MNSLNFLNMLQICDSLFPIGAFTLSNGLETYVQKNIVTTSKQLSDYIKSYISVLPYNELGVAYLSGVYATDLEYIIQLDELYGALKFPFEIRQGNSKTCKRLIKVQERIQGAPSLEKYSKLIKQGNCIGLHPIAVGLFIKDMNINLDEALTIYSYSIISAIVTNCVKLVPLSQLDGQKVLNDSFKDIQNAVEIVKDISVDDIGVSGAEFDVMAIKHETLYSKLYMS